MTRATERMNAHPRSDEQLARLFDGGWPQFIFHDRETKKYIGEVRARFADWELVVLEDDVLVAAGWAVPLRWNGTTADLPAGYNDALARSMAEPAGAAAARPDRAGPADTLVILAAQVHPDRLGQGLAGVLLTALREAAVEAGLPRVICPVRPTHKSRYPLTPIERYAAWTRADGLSPDSWIRTHQRLGARILAPAPRSQTITGTVAEWERWTGLLFPDTGPYVIPDGLATLHIDRAADQGIYIEPNIWLQHA